MEDRALTLYERALGDIEYPYRGEQLSTVVGRTQSWPRRRLRFVAKKLWLAHDLYAHVDRERLAKIATVESKASLFSISLNANESLSALQEALTPILPSYDDVIAAQEEQAAHQTDRFQRAYALEQTAIAQTALAEREAEPARLHRALELLGAALQLYSAKESPQGYASMARNRGVALTRLGERTGDLSRMEEGVAAQREAVEALEATLGGGTPGDRQAWVQSRVLLAAALTSLGARAGRLADLEEAAAILRDCHIDRLAGPEAALFDAVLGLRRGTVAIQIAKLRGNRGEAEAARAEMERAMQQIRGSGQSHIIPRLERLLKEADALLALSW